MKKHNQSYSNVRKRRKHRKKHKVKIIHDPVFLIDEETNTYMFGYLDESTPRETGEVIYNPFTGCTAFIPFTNGGVINE